MPLDICVEFGTPCIALHGTYDHAFITCVNHVEGVVEGLVEGVVEGDWQPHSDLQEIVTYTQICTSGYRACRNDTVACPAMISAKSHPSVAFAGRISSGFHMCNVLPGCTGAYNLRYRADGS